MTPMAEATLAIASTKKVMTVSVMARPPSPHLYARMACGPRPVPGQRSRPRALSQRAEADGGGTGLRAIEGAYLLRHGLRCLIRRRRCLKPDGGAANGGLPDGFEQLLLVVNEVFGEEGRELVFAF